MADSAITLPASEKPSAAIARRQTLFSLATDALPRHHWPLAISLRFMLFGVILPGRREAPFSRQLGLLRNYSLSPRARVPPRSCGSS